MNLLPIDELNQLQAELERMASTEQQTKKDEIVDSVLDILIISYIYGVNDANEMLGTSYTPNDQHMSEAIFKKIRNEDFQQRIQQATTTAEIIRVAETESHRIYNRAVMDIGHDSGLELSKKWVTKLDERVRDTHDYLEGMAVPFDSRFYTFDGDSASYPGDFEFPQNNVNCRCTIQLVVSE